MNAGDEVVGRRDDGIGRFSTPSVGDDVIRPPQHPRNRPMRIQHLINGEPVEGRDSSEATRPRSSLAEVAAGGADEVAAAWLPRPRPFPGWASGPATERARLMHRLGDLISGTSRDLRRRDARHRAGDRADAASMVRAADNFHHSPRWHRVDGTPIRRRRPELHAVPSPVGVCALISPVERAVHDRDVEGARLPRVRQHRGAEDERARR